MRRLLIALLFGTSLCAPAWAQERALHQKTSDLLRSWPSVGRWDVTLIRDKDGVAECRLSTALEGDGTIASYNFGFDSRNGEIEARISGSNRAFSVGDKIAILVDDTLVGSFPITILERSVANDVAEANISQEYGNKITNLFNVGAKIKFVADAVTYEAPLDSARVAMVYFGDCSADANHLDAIEHGHKRSHGRSALQS